MLAPIGAPLRFAVPTQAARPQTSANEEMGPPLPSTFSQTKGSDLERELEEHKALSLEFQLMRAIARQNASTEKSNDSTVSQSKVPSEDSFGQFSGSSISSQTLQVDQLQGQFSLTFETISSTTIEVSRSGGESNFSLSFSQQTSFSLSVSTATPEPQRADPLILNLDDTDFSFDPKHRVSFDLNADGSADSFQNIGNGNAFLAFDRNANGVIDNGTELFGDAGGAVDGFADLAQFDDNRDNQIDANDRIFENLLLLNFDSEGAQQTTSLASQNIESLSLNYESRQKDYSADNLLVSEAEFERTDGSAGRIGDFLLGIV